jgi:hypothetical protein
MGETKISKNTPQLRLGEEPSVFFLWYILGIRGCIKMVRISKNPKLPKGGLENS